MNSQKIALFVTPGENNQRLIIQALKRGHTATAIVRDETQFQLNHPNLKVLKGDVTKKEDVSRHVKGNDVVICAYEPTKTQFREYANIIRTVIQGVKDAGVNHLLFSAHPVGLPAEPTEEFYNSFKPIAQAQRDALNIFQNEKELHWGYVHSIEPEAEQITGKYRVSTEVLFTYPEGESRKPVKEYASAIIYEIEKGEMELHEHGKEAKEN